MPRLGANTGGRAPAANSLQDRAYQLLRKMIAAGQIKPGERLLEAEIVRAFGISRSPARQALEQLCREGVVQEISGRGYRVPGKTPTAELQGVAVLEPVTLSAPRQWERIYGEVEQELFIQTLFSSIRINELRLAQHFDVSRSVTRDLLVRLHGLRLIAKDKTGRWLATKMTPDRIRHLYEMRILLEPEALLKVAPVVPRSTLACMRDHIVAAKRMNPLQSATFDALERELHIDMLALCPNQEIVHALRRTHLLFGPTRYLFDPFLGIPIKLIKAALAEHLAILESLLQDKPEDAATALRKHLTDAIDRWLLRFQITTRMAPPECPPYLTPVE
jgi:DNA-binding GntR family transcriptional regulator